MRIGVVTATAGQAGGTETYLEQVLPRLRAEGHDVALCVERAPTSRSPLLDRIHPSATFVLERNRSSQLAALREWAPDVILMNGIEDSRAELDMLEMAPAALFAHTYRGTCISATKMHALPSPRPCERPFNAACLAIYFPRRCGGRSPRTMVRAFRLQRSRQRLLGRYARILTLSEHMRREYVRNGADARHVHVLPYFGPWVPGDQAAQRPRDAACWRLIFVGRMEVPKGGRLFLRSLASVTHALGMPLEVTFVGDGRDRACWEAEAARVTQQVVGLRISFTGWLPHDAVTRAIAAADLLVVPSTWPEPFGLVGPEAASFGVPAVAFDVGGISEWLRDGVTGHLATASPPTSVSLAEAIVKSLRDPRHYRRLSAQATARARECTIERHARALLDHLARTRASVPPLVHV